MIDLELVDARRIKVAAVDQDAGGMDKNLVPFRALGVGTKKLDAVDEEVDGPGDEERVV